MANISGCWNSRMVLRSGYQATDSDMGSLGGEKVDETKDRVHRHTRRQVQFREWAQSTDKVLHKASGSV